MATKLNPNTKRYEEYTEGRDADAAVLDKDAREQRNREGLAKLNKAGGGYPDDAPKSSDFPGDMVGFSNALRKYRERQRAGNPQKKAVEMLKGR